MPPRLRGCVVAIGNFDGVHRGHRAVIMRAQARALAMGRPCAVLSFEPHPADFFARKPVIFRLTPLEDKARALAALGLDGLIVLTFDARLAGLGAEAFVEEVLVRQLGVACVVAGYDFHFGKARAGTPDFLRAAGARLGFEVEIVARIAEDAEGSLEAVSSTATRMALEQGDVARAAMLLGHEWSVSGVVEHGKKLGRSLGFPTANLRLDPSCALRPGIYAVRVEARGMSYKGVASFGRRPTFDNGALLLEVMLFDFSGDLYGEMLRVAFVGFIRGEEKFADVEALVARMHMDVDEARALLA
ncbi:MAG: bifunctional riboflavin kinase/FAD synthetase [Hyphomicrobiales bacterium]|nr:bifunctional riboflavin kinase/FAD synthetase [Hyphomicrobiales bacterium]